MTISDLITDYKGDLAIEVKQLTEDEAVDVVSFNVSEAGAIKDTILNAEISKWYVDVTNNAPINSNATIVILLKAVTTSDSTTDTTPTDPSGDGE